MKTAASEINPMFNFSKSAGLKLTVVLIILSFKTFFFARIFENFVEFILSNLF